MQPAKYRNTAGLGPTSVFRKGTPVPDGHKCELRCRENAVERREFCFGIKCANFHEAEVTADSTNVSKGDNHHPHEKSGAKPLIHGNAPEPGSVRAACVDRVKPKLPVLFSLWSNSFHLGIWPYTRAVTKATRNESAISRREVQ